MNRKQVLELSGHNAHDADELQRVADDLERAGLRIISRDRLRRVLRALWRRGDGAAALRAERKHTLEALSAIAQVDQYAAGETFPRAIRSDNLFAAAVRAVAAVKQERDAARAELAEVRERHVERRCDRCKHWETEGGTRPGVCIFPGCPYKAGLVGMNHWFCFDWAPKGGDR